MAGTRAGGLKAAKTNRKRYGKNFYRDIGRKGGSKNDGTGGFASPNIGPDGLTGPERASVVGVIGGHRSKRGPAKKKKKKLFKIF